MRNSDRGRSDRDLTMTDAKVVVFGAGAIGCTLGGYLSKNGVDVTLIARPRYVEQINKNGLTIQSRTGEETAFPKASEKLDFQPDLVLLTVKSQDTVESAKQFKEFVDGVPIVSLQNGIQSIELLADVLDRENIIGGVVAYDARIVRPGRVIFSMKEPYITIGEAFREGGERIKRIRNLLQKNDVIKIRISRNIRGALWSKLVMNVGGNALMTLTELRIRELMGHPKIRRLTVQLMKEAYAVTKKAGINLESSPGFHPGVFGRMPAPILSFSISFLIRFKVTDMKYEELRFLKDIKRGKTEIDYLNGEIVELGKKIGFPTPVNGKIVALTHRMEETGRQMSLDELLTNFK
ncbi:MAG: ketopantoate reductase family protein [Deltaproteobacteria bacterium]|nr:ketopantoate reductase family protein [Deltaproteobacteria bacterium]